MCVLIMLNSISTFQPINLPNDLLENIKRHFFNSSLDCVVRHGDLVKLLHWSITNSTNYRYFCRWKNKIFIIEVNLHLFNQTGNFKKYLHCCTGLFVKCAAFTNRGFLNTAFPRLKRLNFHLWILNEFCSESSVKTWLPSKSSPSVGNVHTRNNQTLFYCESKPEF